MFFKKIAKKIAKTLYNSREFDYNVQAIWVWRSLVARMNGVHEAGSSSLLTQTSKKRRLCNSRRFLRRMKISLRSILRNRRSACEIFKL